MVAGVNGVRGANVRLLAELGFNYVHDYVTTQRTIYFYIISINISIKLIIKYQFFKPICSENNCQGNNHDIIICEQMKCRSLVDSRREKCNQLSNMIANRSLRKNRIIWLPHIIDNKNDICRLTCKNKDNGHIWVSNDFIIDGTPCSYNSSNICIQGKCYLMGCDNVLNSGKRFDACGICDGDNSTCISISNKFQRKIRRGINDYIHMYTCRNIDIGVIEFSQFNV